MSSRLQLRSSRTLSDWHELEHGYSLTLLLKYSKPLIQIFDASLEYICDMCILWGKINIQKILNNKK